MIENKDADLWREVENLRALVHDLCRFRDVVFNDLYLRVRSLEDRLPPQQTPKVVRPGDEFRVGHIVCHVKDPRAIGEVIGFASLSDGPHLRVRLLTDAKWPQEYWPAGSCRFAVPPDPRRNSGTGVWVPPPDPPPDPHRIVGGSGPWVPPPGYVSGPPPAPPSLAQLALDEASEAQKRFVFHAQAAGPPPTSILAASPLAPPEVENLCADAHAREEVLVALVRRAAEEIRDRETKKNLLADLEALLSEKDGP